MTANAQGRSPIAVVGIGCRFPGGACSAEELWQGLCAGTDGIIDVPPDRWRGEAFWSPEAGRAGAIRARRAGFLSGIDRFDAPFFGYFPAEAARLDPQQRLLLEVAYEALEDAGEPLERLAGRRVGVFVGGFMYDYLCMQSEARNRRRIGPYSVMGTALCSLANRISYCFDLRGPSLTLDTACSSSLVALHYACRSIWSGESEAALAAGVNLLLRPESSIVLSQGGFLSPDSACSTFDAAANGYVRAEGVGVVYLKPLDRALADRDSIYAVVHGTATNHGGYVADGFTVPNQPAQEEMLRAAYRDAALDPRRVLFVEAHGTGTPVGDPIEMAAIGGVIGVAPGRQEPCWVGSIKASLGHMEGSAGIAGFVKAALVAQRGVVPRNLRFHRPNPRIDFPALGLRVAAEDARLAADSEERWIGVNSFGAGGSNAHVVLCGPPREVPRGGAQARAGIYRVSARAPAALSARAAALAAVVDGGAPLGDLSYSLSLRSSRHRHQVVLCAGDRGELGEGLRALAAGRVPASALSIEGAEPGARPRLAFVYSGQGGQWAQMGLALAQAEPAFRATLEEVDRAVRAAGGVSVLEELGRAGAEAQIDRTVVAQPTIMAVQVALTALFADYGVVPDGVVGHSIGEVATAWAAGALSLADACAVIHHRSRIQARAAGTGRMLAVGLTEEEATAAIAPYAGRVSIATLNGPDMVSLAGEPEPIAAIAQTLEARGVFHRLVNVEVPYHCHLLEPLEHDLREALGPFRGDDASLPLYSTVTARREPGRHLDGEYWYRNVREPVRLTAAVDRMIEDGYRVFVEIGPHPLLVGGIKKLLARRGVAGTAAPAMTRRERPERTFRLALGAWLAWSDRLDAARCFAGEPRLLRVGRYPWQHERYWSESPESLSDRREPPLHPLLGRAARLVSDPPQQVWEAALDVAASPYLRDHQVDGAMVLPATAHLDLALAIAGEAFPGVDVLLEDVHFDAAVVLPQGDDRLDTRFEIRSAEGEFALCSRLERAGKDAPFTVHSRGRINALHDAFASRAPSLDALRGHMTTRDLVDVPSFYGALREAGLDYGATFRCIDALWQRGEEVLGRLELPAELAADAPRHRFHPALFDACLHAVFAYPGRRGDGGRVYLPARIGRLRLQLPPTRVVWTYARVVRYDALELRADIVVFDDSGAPIAELQGFEARHLGGGRAGVSAEYEHQFEEAPLGAPPGQWFRRPLERAVVIGEGGDRALARALLASGTEVVERSALPLDPAEAFAADLATPLSALPLDRRTEIILFAGTAGRPAAADADREPAEALERRLAILAGHLVSLARALLQLQGIPNVTVITERGARIGSEDRDAGIDVAHAALQGLVRVLRNECPMMRWKLVDMALPEPEDAARALWDELSLWRSDLAELEVALRPERRLVRRLVAVAPDEQRARLAPACGGAYRAHVRERGAIDSLELREVQPLPPGPDEVEITVHAAGLNFKDAMNAMRLLSEDAVGGGLAGARLGVEVAGTVRTVGRGVSDLRVGDAVVARVADGFAGRVLAPRHCVARKPAQLSFVDAAALPVVAMTAYHSLVQLARLAAGEIVLIHSAAGGVGLAALRLAQRLGAQVIATAGTESRRQYLREQGVAHVFDSRSLSFYDQVKAATAGRGADVVVNSLSGRLLTQSLKCLAPCGRFIELGKSDLYRNSRIDLPRLGHNVSLHVVDIDRLAVQRPAAHRELLERALAQYAGAEALAPLPVTTVPIGRLAEGLKALTRAHHVGKIVAQMEGAEVAALPALSPGIRPDGSYLITGGTGGFGLCIARWLVEQGARHLVLASRGGVRDEAAAEVLQELRAAGAAIEVRALDVARPSAVRGLLEEIEASPHPLTGIVHGAAVLEDLRVTQLGLDSFLRVLRPKALGAWNLHRAVTDLGLRPDHFLLLSSLSSVFGVVGQASYATANSLLDALAEHRGGGGAGTTSLQLGVLGRYAGMSGAEGASDVIAQLASTGWAAMGLVDGLAVVRRALAERPTARLAAAMDWSRFARAYPNLYRDARFSAQFEAAEKGGGARGRRGGVRGALFGQDPAAQVAVAAAALAAALGQILGVPAEDLSLERPLDELGLDSITLTQLRTFILRDFEVTLPIMKLMRGPSLRSLAVELVGGGLTGPAQAGAAAEEGALSADLSPIGEWLVGPRPGPVRPAARRWLCFHSMGAGASLFRRFLVAPPVGCELLAVQTPGRENRIAEPHEEDLERLAERVVAALLPHLDGPFSFWGHSFGGILAFEVARRLRAAGRPLPQQLLVTGTIAPHLISKWQHREVIRLMEPAGNSTEYLLSLSRYVDDVELLRLIFPRMKHDLPLLRGYRHRQEAPLDLPITAVAAQQDEVAYCDEIDAWREHTTGPFSLHRVPGDHWFLNRNHSLLEELLAR